MMDKVSHGGLMLRSIKKKEKKKEKIMKEQT
jgi:hypothetical protein